MIKKRPLGIPAIPSPSAAYRRARRTLTAEERHARDFPHIPEERVTLEPPQLSPAHARPIIPKIATHQIEPIVEPGKTSSEPHIQKFIRAAVGAP